MVKNNFRNNYINTNTLCPLCEEHEDDQNHLFQCEKIKSVYTKPINCKIDDIFSDDENLLDAGILELLFENPLVGIRFPQEMNHAEADFQQLLTIIYPDFEKQRFLFG